MTVLHISHGADPGDGTEPDWFVVLPREGQTHRSAVGTPITHGMAVSSLLDARRPVFEVDTEAMTVTRLEPGLAAAPQPAYPDVRVTEPALSEHERETLILAVSGALAGAGYEEQARLFIREAETFTSYRNVLRAAQHWVTVTGRETAP